MTTLSSRMRCISELEKKCRDALRHDSIFKILSIDIEIFDKLCAMLDFIADTEDALSCAVTTEQRASFNSYFLAYGILQIMYSRQVAVRAVITALRIQGPKPRAGALETARDRVIGHPITSDKAAHIIVRHTLNEDGFEYWSYYSGESKRGNVVRYEELIEEHVKCMENGMNIIYMHISNIENERRRQMRKFPISKTLQGVSYLTTQICAALDGEIHASMFEPHSEMLVSALNCFRGELVKRRGEGFSAQEVDHIIEGVCMLKEIFLNVDFDLNSRSRRQFIIIADGVDMNVNNLVKAAKEIDDEEKEDLI